MKKKKSQSSFLNKQQILRKRGAVLINSDIFLITSPLGNRLPSRAAGFSLMLMAGKGGDLLGNRLWETNGFAAVPLPAPRQNEHPRRNRGLAGLPCRRKRLSGALASAGRERVIFLD